MLIMNNRGQGLSTNAIVLIILAVVVLAVLVIGFTMGWDKLAPWLDSNNVDTIVQQCSIACATNSVNDYCTKVRTLDDGENPEITGTCKDFSEMTYGVEDCSNICVSPGGKEYVWVGIVAECVDKAKGQRIVPASNCDSDTRPNPGICCEQDKQ